MRDVKNFKPMFRGNDYKHMTTEEVANVLGCTPRRVQQIEYNALKKLRKAWRAKYLVEFVDWYDINEKEVKK